MTRVLVIEPDPDRAQAIVDVLAKDWEIVQVRTWQVGLAHIEHEPVAVAVMALPDVPVFGPLKMIAGTVPTIVYSSADNRDAAVESGAYQYVLSPPDPELLTRLVRTAARRISQPRANVGVRQFGELMVDPAAVEAYIAGRPLGLTASEFRLLYVLAERADSPVSREELIERVAGRNRDRGRLIDVLVMRIRRKIAALSPTRLYIHSCPKSGYELKAEPAVEPEHLDRRFRKEVLPRIADVPASKLAQATGLSARYCQLIRKGERTPRLTHWDVLLGAAMSDDQRSGSGGAN